MRDAISSHIVILPTVGTVLYREEKMGERFQEIPVGRCVDLDQAEGRKWQVKLGGTSECEFHRRIENAGCPDRGSKETLCLLVASANDDFAKVTVHSRPRHRRHGHETVASLKTKKRAIKFIKNRVELEYRVDKFKITILAV